MFTFFELDFQNKAVSYIFRVPLVITLSNREYLTSHSEKFNDLFLMFQLVNKFIDNTFFVC